MADGAKVRNAEVMEVIELDWLQDYEWPAVRTVKRLESWDYRGRGMVWTRRRRHYAVRRNGPAKPEYEGCCGCGTER